MYLYIRWSSLSSVHHVEEEQSSARFVFAARTAGLWPIRSAGITAPCRVIPRLLKRPAGEQRYVSDRFIYGSFTWQVPSSKASQSGWGLYSGKAQRQTGFLCYSLLSFLSLFFLTVCDCGRAVANNYFSYWLLYNLTTNWLIGWKNVHILQIFHLKCNNTEFLRWI